MKFISGDKISSKHYPKWNAYTCPSKYWVLLKCRRNETSCEQNLFSRRFEITNRYKFISPLMWTYSIANDSAKFLSEHVYMRLEVNSNRFEISNCFEKSFCLHDDFTEVKSQTGLSSLGVSRKRALRSSHPEVFLVKGILKICSKFMGEHPCWSAICKATLLKSHFGMVFSCKISNHFEMSFHLRGNLHGDFTPATFQTMARHVYRSTFTWDPMWTQTGLRFNFGLKFYMDVR